MLYTLKLDENNYVLSIGNTTEDNFEVDLDTLDLEHLGAYQLINGKLVLNEQKKQELINSVEIAELKEKLNETDYIISRTFEDIMALDNKLTFITDMIGILVKYSKQYKEQLTNRKQWRNRIEELRGE